MTPKPIIVSIPHTGTRFLKDRLGIEDHVHTNNNWRAIEEKAEGRSIVAPLRSPPQVWRSWCRRNDEKNKRVWMPQFFVAFAVMHTLDQLHDVDFICVDKQSDPRIDDWSTVGHNDGDHAHWKLHDIDLRILYKLPFVERFYGSRG